MKTKTVPFNKDYEVSTTGVVTSLKGGKRHILKPALNKATGYKSVSLSTKGKAKTIDIHRLVALTHIKNPNPKKYNVVNHLDGNKLNNSVSNLEWTDHATNAKHGAALPKNKLAREQRSKARSVRRIVRKESYDVVSALKIIHNKVSAETFSIVFGELTHG